MSVIHVDSRPNDHYTMIPNAWIRDPRLTARAKGLLAYITSHRSGYRLTTAQMVAEMADGRKSIYAGLRELEGAGYLVRSQRRDPATGRVGAVDYVLSYPQAAAETGPQTGPDAPSLTSGNAAKPQVTPADPFAAHGVTSGNAAKPQVTPADPFAAYRKRAPKKTKSKKTKEDQDSVPSVPDQPQEGPRLADGTDDIEITSTEQATAPAGDLPAPRPSDTPTDVDAAAVALLTAQPGVSDARHARAVLRVIANRHRPRNLARYVRAMVGDRDGQLAGIIRETAAAPPRPYTPTNVPRDVDPDNLPQWQAWLREERRAHAAGQQPDPRAWTDPARYLVPA